MGTLAALTCIAVLTAIMLPLRAHLSTATTALVLAIPVVVGVASGGYLAGVISVIAGFVVYDFFFIPPYLTLRVGATENWVVAAWVASIAPTASLSMVKTSGLIPNGSLPPCGRCGCKAGTTSGCGQRLQLPPRRNAATVELRASRCT